MHPPLQVRYRRHCQVLIVVFQPYDGKPHPCQQPGHVHEHWHDVLFEIELDPDGAHVGRWRCGQKESQFYDICDATALAVTAPPLPPPAPTVPGGGTDRAAYTPPPSPAPASTPTAAVQAAAYTPPKPPVARQGRYGDEQGGRGVRGAGGSDRPAGAGLNTDKGSSKDRSNLRDRARSKTLQSAITSFLSNKARP